MKPSDATYVDMYCVLYRDLAVAYNIGTPELTADISFIRRKFTERGMAFFTEDLPALGKLLDQYISGAHAFPWDVSLFGLVFYNEGGQVSEDTTEWWTTRVCVPELFSELWVHLYDDEEVMQSIAITYLRQLCYVFYKLELPYSTLKNDEVINKFIQVESSLPEMGEPEYDDAIARTARALVTRVLGGLDPRDITPRHGPGAVATGEVGGAKRRFSRIYTSLDRLYSFSEYFRVSLTHTADTYDEIQRLSVCDTATAKVVLVPKDSRGPRLISCEPLEVQWIQQGLQAAMYARIERHPLTRGHVNFTDQGVNRDKARSGSRTGQFATLDMKDASDRVSVRLVKSLFCGTRLLEYLLASRSDATKLPDGKVLTLRKFAPMGSAVCFPVEAITFWALAVATLLKHGRSTRQALRSVYVYGDDIICLSSDAEVIMQTLPRYCLEFNTQKCCIGGLYSPTLNSTRFFRESCGMDAFNGFDVTPIKLKQPWSTTYRNIHACVSYVAVANAAYRNGWFGFRSHLLSLVESELGPLPRTQLEEEIPLVVYDGFYLDRSCPKPRRRYNRHLQRVEYRLTRLAPVYRKFAITGWDYLLHVLSMGSTQLPFGMFALARRTRLIRAWGWLG